MDIPKNTFKAALRAGQRQIGLWHSMNDPTVAEVLAGCGYDWIMLDTEHSAIGPPEVITFLRTIAPYPVTPVVRASWNDPVEIKKLLDAGAQTLLIPYVQNADEARAAVASVTYPPKGTRGVSGMTRASRYGAIAGYAKQAGDEICLLVQVETREALANIEDIAQVEGVDGVFIGPADLAASFGHLGEPSHPDVKAAILDAMAQLKTLNVPSGILSLDQELLHNAKDAGAQFIAVDIDSALLRQSALERRRQWQ